MNVYKIFTQSYTYLPIFDNAGFLNFFFFIAASHKHVVIAMIN